MPRSPAPKIEKLKLKHLIWSSTDHVDDSPLKVYRRFDTDELDIHYRGQRLSYPYNGLNTMNENLRCAFVIGGVAKEDEHFPAIPFHTSAFYMRYMASEKTLNKLALKKVVRKVNEVVERVNELKKDAAPST